MTIESNEIAVYKWANRNVITYCTFLPIFYYIIWCRAYKMSKNGISSELLYLCLKVIIDLASSEWCSARIGLGLKLLRNVNKIVHFLFCL